MAPRASNVPRVSPGEPAAIRVIRGDVSPSQPVPRAPARNAPAPAYKSSPCIAAASKARHGAPRRA